MVDRTVYAERCQVVFDGIDRYRKTAKRGTLKIVADK